MEVHLVERSVLLLVKLDLEHTRVAFSYVSHKHLRVFHTLFFDEAFAGE